MPPNNRSARRYGSPIDPRRGNKALEGDKSATLYGRELRDTETPSAKEEDPSPSAELVRKFHKNADVDVHSNSIHHTLGPRNNQASPGDHRHDGGSSPLILEGFVLTGSKANPATMWPSIIQCLVRLGAKDNTT